MLMRKFTSYTAKCGVVVLALCLGTWSAVALASHHEEVEPSKNAAQSEVYELRTYTLIYIIAHDSREAADGNWREFVNDPDWQKVYAASIANGRLVKNIDSVFMTKTDYSP